MLRLSSQAARRVCSAALVALGAVAICAGAPSTAKADALPFWEKRDVDDGKAAYHGGKVVYSKNTRTRARKKLGGYAAKTEPRRTRSKGVKVAALGNTYYPPEAPSKSITGGGVRWAAPSGCLDAGLRSVIASVASNFGPLTVNSTCRSKSRNRAVGGAHKSKHLTGDAVDFRVRGNVRAVYAYLRSSGSVGGLKHYGGGLFHIDTGPRRSW